MKELKRKLGWILLFWGVFWWVTLLIGSILFGWKELIVNVDKSNFSILLFFICNITCIPMLVGSILLINEE